MQRFIQDNLLQSTHKHYEFVSLKNYCAHLCRPGISAVAAAHDAFMRNEPPPEASDAAWLLDFYSSFIGDTCDALDTTHRALECLAQACSSLN